MYQPCPSSGGRTEPPRPPAPAPVRAGLAAVWLLWRPASSAFFKPHNTPA